MSQKFTPENHGCVYWMVVWAVLLMLGFCILEVLVGLIATI